MVSHLNSQQLNSTNLYRNYPGYDGGKHGLYTLSSHRSMVSASGWIGGPPSGERDGGFNKESAADTSLLPEQKGVYP